MFAYCAPNAITNSHLILLHVTCTWPYSPPINKMRNESDTKDKIISNLRINFLFLKQN